VVDAGMATVEIGIRIDMAKGLAYFGVDDVNQRLAAGARVIEIRPAGAIINQVGEGDGDQVRMSLAGCRFEVVVEDA